MSSSEPFRTGALTGIAAILCVGALWAAPADDKQAAAAVRGWLRQEAAPMGVSLGRDIRGVTTYRDDKGAAVYHVVAFVPSGFAIVSADDQIEPVIAFAGSGMYDPSDRNPLGALVTHDLPGRLAAVQETSGRDMAALRASKASARGKWRNLIDRAAAPAVEAGLGSVSDVRVAPLIATRWSQTTVSGNACYNYYTPPGAEGTATNYPSGCAATACAQLMRFWQHPVAGVGTPAFNIAVDSVVQPRNLRGGDGAGGAYSWSDMVLVPASGSTLVQRQAIGALCHDAGVAINMGYTASGSGADTLINATALVNTFGYSNAVKGYNSGGNIGAGLNAMANPNLDAGYPVLFGITGTPGGHAIVGDGYGYSSGTLYHHCNMGWAGTSDAWYNLPTIDSAAGTFTSTYKCVVTCTSPAWAAATGAWGATWAWASLFLPRRLRTCPTTLLKDPSCFRQSVQR